MKKTMLSNINNEIKPLSKSEQTDIKGGILICCEEKRRNFFGISYTTTQWNVVNDGSIWISIQM